MLASAAPSQRCGGSSPSPLSSCIVSQQMAASMAPAAPSVCPVSGLVPLTAQASPKIVCTTAPSISSFAFEPVACRFTYSTSPAVRSARASAASIASVAPRPEGSGAEK
jgi:hypothetical protein